MCGLEVLLLAEIKVFGKFGQFSLSWNASQNLLKTMVLVAHKYSANEALATLILASGSESNDLFDDESA